MRTRAFVPFVALVLLLACGTRGAPPVLQPRVTTAVDPFLEDLEKKTFEWFWDTTNASNGLVPDRWPDINFSSIAAIGFGLTAYGVGAERGYVTRQQARDRTLTTLQFLWKAPQHAEPRDVTGYRGFFYHFLDMEKGHRYRTVELSAIDTALMMAGVLFAQSYFDRDDAGGAGDPGPRRQAVSPGRMELDAAAAAADRDGVAAGERHARRTTTRATKRR